MTRPRTSRTLIALAALALAGAVATVAFADVVVYKNGFSSRAEVDEMKKSGGKKCKRKFVRKGKKRFMRATLTKGPGACSMRPPVQGDDVLPDYTLQVKGKLAKATPKSVLKSAYLAVAGRAAGQSGYELRVFPKRRRFQLVRTPDGAEFPVKGTSSAIGKVGKKNALRISFSGARVRAIVNGREVADVADPDPGDVTGTKLRFAVANNRKSGKNTVAAFQKLKVAVPEP
jgi:hypothetical protein